MTSALKELPRLPRNRAVVVAHRYRARRPGVKIIATERLTEDSANVMYRTESVRPSGSPALSSYAGGSRRSGRPDRAWRARRNRSWRAPLGFGSCPRGEFPTVRIDAHLECAAQMLQPSRRSSGVCIGRTAWPSQRPPRRPDPGPVARRFTTTEPDATLDRASLRSPPGKGRGCELNAQGSAPAEQRGAPPRSPSRDPRGVETV
jgi:hypothetical protein